MCSNELNDIISLIIVFCIYFFSYIIIIISLKMKKKIVYLFFIAIGIRILFTIINFYVFPDILPHSGKDSRTFELMGYYLMNGFVDISTYSWDNYPRIIYSIYSIIGRKPLVLVGINGVLNIFSAFYLNRILFMTTENEKKVFWGTAIFLLFPQSIIFSSVILRENLIVFFLVLSIYLFVVFCKKKKVIWFCLSIFTLLIASYFHAGVIFTVSGYLFFLYKEKKEINIQGFLNKLIIFIGVGLIVFVFLTQSDLFFRKIIKYLNSSDILLDRLGRTIDAGSAYLQGYNIKTLKNILLFIPLKFVYFFFSPMPWALRGINDLIAFSLDSIIYFYLISKVTLNFWILKWNSRKNIFYKSICIGLIVTGIVFSLGTFNSGTAIRHRYKLFSLTIIAASFPINIKRFKKINNN